MKKLFLTTVVLTSLLSVQGFALPVQNGLCTNDGVNGFEIPCVSMAKNDVGQQYHDKVKVYFTNDKAAVLQSGKHDKHLSVLAGHITTMGDLMYQSDDKEAQVLRSNHDWIADMSSGQPYTTAHMIIKLETYAHGCSDTHEIIPGGLRLPNGDLLCYAYAG